MNIDNPNLYAIPDNDFGIEVPRIERPLNYEKLATIGRYIDQIVNHHPISIEYFTDLQNCWHWVNLVFLFPQIETRIDPTVAQRIDQLAATILNQQQIIDTYRRSSDIRQNRTDTMLNDLQSAITANSEDIRTMKSSITANSEDIRTMQSSITANSEDIRTMQSSITAIQETMATMQGYMNTTQERVDRNHQESTARSNELANTMQRNFDVIKFELKNPVRLNFPWHVPAEVRALAATESELLRLTGAELDRILLALELPTQRLVEDKKKAILDYLNSVNYPIRDL